MSRFYGDLKGNRGEATRCGSKDSGIRSHARGWYFGGKVVMYVDPATGEDYMEVYATHGSNGYGQSKLLFRGLKKDCFPE